MRIRTFVVLLLLAPTIPHAANACGKLQPTLRAYYIQEHGEGYLKGIVSVPTPEEGATCEKIRYDLRYWHCQWKSAKLSRSQEASLKRQTETNALGIPLYVQRGPISQGEPSWRRGGKAAQHRAGMGPIIECG